MDERAETLVVEVLRYTPEQDPEPRWQRYELACSREASVLEVLQQIKDDIDPALGFRWSCRMAICGSCGMMINGVPKLACRTFVHELGPGVLRVEPLEHFPIERDLVVGAADFLRKLESVTPYLVRKEPLAPSAGECLQTPEELERFHQFTKCINCMLCYAACPQYGLDATFLGPAAVTLAHRYNADSRDSGAEKRMELLHTEEGLWSCTAVGYCSEVCPKDVDPANAVNQNKMASALDYFLRFLRPGSRS